MKKLNFYYLDLKFIRNLTRVDDNVMSISPQRGKENRPFVGIIVLVNGRNYCIPLTSPKYKFMNMKSQVDFIKIFDESKIDENGTFKLIGVLNINNMIPVDDSVIRIIDLTIHNDDSKDIKNHKELMQKQLKWCREHTETIINRANKVYNKVVNEPDKNKNLVRRSSKFLELEKVIDNMIVKTTPTKNDPESLKIVSTLPGMSQVIFERGLRKGEAKGKQKALIKKICCKLRKLKSVEEIADELEEDYSRVKVICDTAMNFAPDYDEEKVINAVLEPIK